MQIQRSFEPIPPIIQQPRHDPDDMKTPTQLQIETEKNARNEQSKQIAQQATSKVYEMLDKLVRNTEYNVSFNIDESGHARQFKFHRKNDGQEIVSIPPDIAVQMADRAKTEAVGLIVDRTV